MVTRSYEPRNPYEADDGVTQLQDDVLGLLEAADLPQAINDKIIALVRQGETEKYERDNPEAPGV